MYNPEMQRHIELERRMAGNDPCHMAMVEAIVASEYEGTEPQQCPACEATAYYKATSSVWKCQGCGAIMDHSGELYK